LTGDGDRATLAHMATGEALGSNEVLDRMQLTLSLAAAVLISAAGFALIFVLIGELPRLLLTKSGDPTPMVAALLPFFSSPIGRVYLPMLPFLMVFPAILVAARKRRSTSARRAHKF
jgi:hypothetical protein